MSTTTGAVAFGLGIVWGVPLIRALLYDSLDDRLSSDSSGIPNDVVTKCGPETVVLARTFPNGYEDTVTTVAEKAAETRLDRWLEDGPRPWRDVVTVFLDVGEKLAASHAQGVFYQELRIENIVVGADGRGDVRELNPAILDMPKVGPGSTRTAAISLEQRLAEMKSTESVAYLAPEQFRGRAADARSNQFSFGVALYRALYRQSPFDHDWAASQAGESRRTPLGSIHFDLLIQSFDRATLINLAREVLSGNLRPPPEETDVPPWLEQILRRVLQTDPEERYPSLRRLLDDIAQETGVPATVVVEQRPPSRKWAIMGGVGLVVFLLGLLALLLGRAR